MQVQESAYGPSHEKVATYLDKLAQTYYLQGRYADGEPLYKRSLAIWEVVLGGDNPELATTLDNLAVVYAAREKFALAEPLYRRSQALRQKANVQSLNNLALVLEGKGERAEAEVQYKRAIALAERIPALPGSASVGETALLATTLRNYAALLRQLKREAEAAKLDERVQGLEKTAPAR
jgi:tetratricopeptide (TPR) repeat protein